MSLTREDLRAAFEAAGDEHWRALIAHHEEAYPEPRPTPGDVCRGEAERLNELGYGDPGAWQLLESRARRVNERELAVVHRLRSRTDATELETPEFINYA